jgi:hypothetical protein
MGRGIRSNMYVQKYPYGDHTAVMIFHKSKHKRIKYTSDRLSIEVLLCLLIIYTNAYCIVVIY